MRCLYCPKRIHADSPPDHLPTFSIPDFLSGARYEATDGKTPRYNALYDIKDFHLFSEPKYSNLRANRSPREADLVKRLGTLDRRTCKTIYDSGRETYSADTTAPYITTLYVQPEEGKDAQMQSWLKGAFLEAMKAVPGWKRTSIHEVVDSLVISASASPKSNSAAKYLIVNGEYDFLLEGTAGQAGIRI